MLACLMLCQFLILSRIKIWLISLHNSNLDSWLSDIHGWLCQISHFYAVYVCHAHLLYCDACYLFIIGIPAFASVSFCLINKVMPDWASYLTGLPCLCDTCTVYLSFLFFFCWPVIWCHCLCYVCILFFSFLFFASTPWLWFYLGSLT